MIDIGLELQKAFDEGYEKGKADRPQKVIAQISFDEEKLREIVHEAVERIKEEYDIVDGWIPCSERLPEEQGVYLVTTYACDDYYYVDILSFHKGKFYSTDSEWGDMIDDDVTAWMPLPKPYGEREGE